jgi:hypothetical protein
MRAACPPRRLLALAAPLVTARTVTWLLGLACRLQVADGRAIPVMDFGTVPFLIGRVEARIYMIDSSPISGALTCNGLAVTRRA